MLFSALATFRKARRCGPVFGFLIYRPLHNAVTRIVTKPTHMIGGYAQLAYGFNYYGTVGANRDEFCIVRKMNKVDWMDEPAGPAYSHARPHPMAPQA